MESNVNDSKAVVQFVRCLKCNKILKISRFDTDALLDHIRTDHPEIEIINRVKEPKPLTLQEKYPEPEAKEDDDLTEVFPKRKETKEQPACDRPEVTGISINSEEIPSSEEGMICSTRMSTDVIYSARCRMQGSSSTDYQSPMKRRMYRASIIKWRPAVGTLYCPNCGCRKRPLMKSRAERMSYNSCGVCCILTCWPFCFLPCLFPSQDQEYLYCANCKTFLGLYDRGCNCIKPNRKYVDLNDNDAHASEDNKEDDPIADRRRSNDNTYDSNKLLKEKPSTGNISDDNLNSDLKRIESGKVRANSTDDYLPSVTIDGKPVPPYKVAQIKKLNKYRGLTGLDFNSLTDDSKTSRSETHRNDVGNEADSEDNNDKETNLSKRKTLRKRKHKLKNV